MEMTTRRVYMLVEPETLDVLSPDAYPTLHGARIAAGRMLMGKTFQVAEFRLELARTHEAKKVRVTKRVRKAKKEG